MTTITESRQDAWKRKIQSLLERASHPNTSEAEAETAREMADRLMTKWGIEEAMLLQEETKSGEKVEMRHMTLKGTYGYEWMRLANEISHGLGGVRVVYSNYEETYHVTYIGHRGDLTRFEFFFESLKSQAESALRKWWKGHREMLKSEGTLEYYTEWEQAKVRMSFIRGFGERVGTRLYRLYKEEVLETTGAEVALVDRNKKVQNFMDENFSNLRQTKSKRDFDELASYNGHQAGDKASLSTGEVGGDSKGQIH